jgi:hypothetical protein
MYIQFEPGIMPEHRVSFAKIQNTLGFECRQSVEDGLREIADLVNNGVIKDFDNPEHKNI